jgi:hypothetical protein
MLLDVVCWEDGVEDDDGAVAVSGGEEEALAIWGPGG